MKILITGGNGYVAKSICRALEGTYEVTSIARQDIDLLNTRDVLDYFRDKYFDVVIHCAVVGGSRLQEDTWQVLDANLLMYYNLLSCRSSYEKLIHFNSGAEIFMPDTPYGFSKKVIAKSMRNDAQFYNLKIFGVFDENELDTRFIKANLKRYINKEPIQVHQNKLMDFFYMEDLISVVKYYIEGVYLPKQLDLSYGDYNNLLDIAEIINRLDSYTVPTIVAEQGFGKPYVGTYTSLPIEYVGLEEGIKRTYNKLKNEAN